MEIGLAAPNSFFLVAVSFLSPSTPWPHSLLLGLGAGPSPLTYPRRCLFSLRLPASFLASPFFSPPDESILMAGFSRPPRCPAALFPGVPPLASLRRDESQLFSGRWLVSFGNPPHCGTHRQNGPVELLFFPPFRPKGPPPPPTVRGVITFCTFPLARSASFLCFPRRNNHIVSFSHSRGFPWSPRRGRAEGGDRANPPSTSGFLFACLFVICLPGGAPRGRETEKPSEPVGLCGGDRRVFPGPFQIKHPHPTFLWRTNRFLQKNVIRFFIFF